MLPKTVYWTLLFVICGYALWKGKSDERVVATTALLATLGTRLFISPLSARYTSVEVGVLLVDIAALTGFVVVALRSERFWPLWIAALQLTSSMAHLLKAVEWDLLPKAYGAAAVFWSYPILLILAVGTWRGQHPPAYRREAAAT